MRSNPLATAIQKSLFLTLGAITLFALLDFLLTRSAHSAEPQRLSQATCEAAAFDYAARFGPEGNQGDQGQCYAFVAAGLAAEHACASGKIRCGTPLSAIDISRDFPGRTTNAGLYESREYFALGIANQGGVEFKLLDAALEHGVCAEADAPWFPEGRGGCKDRLTRPSCLLGKLLEARGEYLEHEKEWLRLVRAGSEDQRVEHVFRRASLLSEIEEVLPSQAPQELDLREILSKTSTQGEFLQAVLIPPRCRQNRVFLAGQAWHEDWGRLTQNVSTESHLRPDGTLETHHSREGRSYRSLYSLSERFRQFTQWRMLSQRSVGLALCAASALEQGALHADDPSTAEVCRPHGLIASGLRWNPSRARCEIQIRNSWSQPTRLRGWVPVEPVLRATFRISGLL